MARMLGRRPPKNTPALRLAAFLTGQVPAHPVAADHFTQVKTWFLGHNDKFGTCGPTSDANYLKLVFKYLLGEDITVTDAAIFDLYRRSGNPGFDPKTGAGDDGVDMQTMLEAMRSGGLDIIRADGTHQNIKPLAFAKVNPSNLDEIRAAISIFGGVLFGVDLEVAQQGQSDAHPPVWDYQRSGEWGGHAICAGRYTSATSGPDVAVVSWAEVVGTTDAFIRSQLQEVWCLVLEQHLEHPAFQQGVDLAALKAAYTEVTGAPFPDVPGPSPSPTPQPGPPSPGPPPSPAPVPTPVVDASDRALAAAVKPWATNRHTTTAAKQVAKALETWLAAKHL